uniref:Uncharacterized protein n=1 Tax=Nicotiana tabacum TaxID=4097 RepID=A0A1S4BPP2_TOBAC|nr:PREDICTED: uncharacterized protein LOC107810555 [Nicotiana tabacum]
MNAVGPAYLFNEAQHALNRASVLHHEAFLRIREEHDAEGRSLTKKSDSYRLICEKLRADLTAAREEHEEMTEQVFRMFHDSEDEKEITTNDAILQGRQRIEQIGRLNSQLRSAKENASGLIEKMKELQHQLDLATSDKADLAKELEVARSEVIEANKRADAKVAQFRIDVEVNQAKAESMVEHAKWQAWREALEKVRAQGFDIGAEIEVARAEENKARRLAFPEEDSDDSGESEDEDDAENTASDED